MDNKRRVSIGIPGKLRNKPGEALLYALNELAEDMMPAIEASPADVIDATVSLAVKSVVVAAMVAVDEGAEDETDNFVDIVAEEFAKKCKSDIKQFRDKSGK